MIQLQIEQQYARIGMHTELPRVQLQTTLPAIELSRKSSELAIKNHQPRLTIDQSRCFAAVNRRSPAEFSRYMTEQARTDILDDIARIVSEGHMLGEIEKGATVADLAASAADYDFPSLITQSIPPPTISWQITPPSIHFEPGKVQVELKRGQVENNFQPSKVEIYLVQQNYLKIDWLQPALDLTV